MQHTEQVLLLKAFVTYRMLTKLVESHTISV